MYTGFITASDGLVVSEFASLAVGHGFVSQLCHIKDHHKMVQTASLLCMHVLG